MIVLEFFRFLNIVLPELFELIKDIRASIAAANKRLKDAETAEEASKLMAKEASMKEEKAMLAAFKLAVDASLAAKQARITLLLVENKPEEVLKMIATKDWDFAYKVIADSNYSCEYKAVKLVLLMKPV